MWRYLFFLIALAASISAKSDNFSPGSAGKEKVFKEGEVSSQLRIYPNPFTGGVFNVDFLMEEITEIKITNISGKEVLNIKNKIPVARQYFSLDNIPNGVYLLNVKTKKNNFVTKKLVISLK